MRNRCNSRWVFPQLYWSLPSNFFGCCYKIIQKTAVAILLPFKKTLGLFTNNNYYISRLFKHVAFIKLKCVLKQRLVKKMYHFRVTTAWHIILIESNVSSVPDTVTLKARKSTKIRISRGQLSSASPIFSSLAFYLSGHVASIFGLTVLSYHKLICLSWANLQKETTVIEITVVYFSGKAYTLSMLILIVHYWQILWPKYLHMPNVSLWWKQKPNFY